MRQFHFVFPKLTVSFSLCIEHGEFLALDLGGTNFRVLRVRVTDNGLQKVEMENQIYAIPEDIMRGSGTQVCLSLRVYERLPWGVLSVSSPPALRLEGQS